MGGVKGVVKSVRALGLGLGLTSVRVRLRHLLDGPVALVQRLTHILRVEDARARVRVRVRARPRARARVRVRVKVRVRVRVKVRASCLWKPLASDNQSPSSACCLLSC